MAKRLFLFNPGVQSISAKHLQAIKALADAEVQIFTWRPVSARKPSGVELLMLSSPDCDYRNLFNGEQVNEDVLREIFAHYDIGAQGKNDALIVHSGFEQHMLRCGSHAATTETMVPLYRFLEGGLLRVYDLVVFNSGPLGAEALLHLKTLFPLQRAYWYFLREGGQKIEGGLPVSILIAERLVFSDSPQERQKEFAKLYAYLQLQGDVVVAADEQLLPWFAFLLQQGVRVIQLDGQPWSLPSQ